MIGAILTPVLGFIFDSLVGKGVVVAAGLMALIGAFSITRHYEQRGAEKAVAKMERIADAKVKSARRARHSVLSVPVERLRDPYLRDE